MPPHHKKKKQKKQSQPSGISKENTNSTSACDHSIDVPLEANASYSVKRTEQVGRYLVASRDLKAGDIIIETSPIIVGPCAETEPVCLGCHSTFIADSVIYRCENCNWRICSPNCHGLITPSIHSRLECIPLRDKAVHKLLQTSTPVQVKLMYEAILTLRCMLLKTVDFAMYDRLLDMDPLNDVRQQIPKLWNRNQKDIVQRIRNDWGFEMEFTEQELHTICGIIEVNSFEVGQEPIKARALFPKAYLLMHDCTPNTGHTDELRTHYLTVRVLRDVKAGESLTLTYAHILQGTLKRRQHLKEEKFFYCNCRRCSDPTELGTYCSALRCNKCRKGHILPVNPLNHESEWLCQQCPNGMSCESVIMLLEKLSRQLGCIGAKDVDGLETFLRIQSTVLHDNHYLLLSVKHSLCELYGKIESYLIPQLSPDQLKRKEILCRDLLEVVDQLEPGLSRLKGTIMYELHVPLLIESGQQFQRGIIQRTELRRRLKEVQKLLKESEKILSLEPEGSPEHSIAEAAREALENMGSV